MVASMSADSRSTMSWFVGRNRFFTSTFTYYITPLKGDMYVFIFAIVYLMVQIYWREKILIGQSWN